MSCTHAYLVPPVHGHGCSCRRRWFILGRCQLMSNVLFGVSTTNIQRTLQQTPTKIVFVSRCAFDFAPQKGYLVNVFVSCCFLIRERGIACKFRAVYCELILLGTKRGKLYSRHLCNLLYWSLFSSVFLACFTYITTGRILTGGHRTV